MLKLLTTTSIIHQSKTKCGEIYCHSYLDITIYCTFCDIKLFAYDDFLLHLQNVHFDNNLFKSKLQPSKDEVKNELENKVEEVKVFSDNSYVDSDSKVDKDVYTSSDEDESITIIKNNQKIRTLPKDGMKDDNSEQFGDTLSKVSFKFYFLLMVLLTAFFSFL